MALPGFLDLMWQQKKSVLTETINLSTFHFGGMFPPR